MDLTPHFTSFTVRLLALGAIGSSMLGVSACAQAAGEIAYETIEQREAEVSGQSFQNQLPRLVIITGPDDIAQVEDLITQEASEELAEMDYGEYFAILVNQEQKDVGGYAVNIQRIVRRDDEITVVASFREPNSGEELQEVETVPYQLVRVRKSREFGDEFTFTLLATMIIQKDHFIP